MGLLEDMFTPPHELRTRREIDALRDELSAQPNVSLAMARVQAEVDRLALVCRALTELVVAKGVATRSELSVLLQQIDLEDGTEDGRLTQRKRNDAPRCSGCDRFVNPRREQCVYCGRATDAGGGAGPYRDRAQSAKPTATAECGNCSKVVPESETWFTGSGLMCAGCYDALSD